VTRAAPPGRIEWRSCTALRFAVDRISKAGGLASPWTVDAATGWIWARVQPSAWALLVTERGWRPEDFKRRTVDSLLAEILAAERA
jgi:hypothetical protein